MSLLSSPLPVPQVSVYPALYSQFLIKNLLSSSDNKNAKQEGKS